MADMGPEKVNWVKLLVGAAIFGAVSIAAGMIVWQVHPPPDKAHFLDQEVNFAGTSMAIGAFVAYLFQRHKRIAALALIIAYAVGTITLIGVVVGMSADL